MSVVILTPTQKMIENKFKAILTSPSNLKRLIFFDKNSGTTLTDKSGNGQNATLSLDASSLNPDVAGKARILNFDAAGDYWDFADSDDLSFGNGTTDSPFSIVACINPNDVTACKIVTKQDVTTGSVKSEYTLDFSSSKLRFGITDSSSVTYLIRSYNTVVTPDIGTYHSYIGTYNGGKVITGLKIYRDGVRVDDTSTINGTFAGMSNTASKVGSYRTSTAGAKETVGNYKGAFIAIIAEELSQTQVTAIDDLLRKYVGAI